MNSFALWLDSKAEIDNGTKAEVHFNLWNMHYKDALPPFLDVGIKLNNVSDFNCINFFVPFVLANTDISDLGSVLKEGNILCTIFNEDYIVSQNGGSKLLTVQNNKSEAVMGIYCLDVKNDIKVENKFDGTLISIPKPTSVNGQLPIYFRFRIQSRMLKKIIKCYNPQNIFLQSAFSTIEAIDFRFNDYRSVHPSLLEQIRLQKSYNIEKVHFLLVTEADVDLQYSSVSATARELEKDVWKQYFPYIKSKNIVAYHWKFKSINSEKLIENCIMFVKTKVHKCNWLTILLYLLVLGAITMFFEFISRLIF